MIDPSIALGVRPIQLDNPVESYGKALGLKALMMQNTMGEQSMADSQRLRQIYSNPSAQDPASLRDLLYKSGVPGGVTAGVALDKDVLANQKEQLLARKSQLDNVAQQHALISSSLNALGQNPSIDQIGQVFQHLQSNGVKVDPAGIPQNQADVPAWIQKQVMTGQTVGEQLTEAQQKWEHEFKTSEFANTLRHQDVEESQGAQKVSQGAEHVKQGWIQTDPFGTLRSAATNFGVKTGGTPGSTPTTAGAPDATQSVGDQFLTTIPKPLADQVKALAEGRLAFPAGFALKSPYWQNMLQMVSQYDPTFDAVNFNSRVSTRKDFTSGKSAQATTALNTVIGHLDTLSKASDALNNTSYPAFNNIANWMANNSGDPRVKEFDNTRKAVVDELTRVWRGTGGSEGDIKSWTDTLGAANSPAQLHGVIKNIGDLLESRINALGDQYKRGMGTTEQGLELLTPKSRSTLNQLEQKASGNIGNGVQVRAVGAAAPIQGKPLPPMTNAKGWTLHIDADGHKAYVSPDQKQFEEVQ